MILIANIIALTDNLQSDHNVLHNYWKQYSLKATTLEANKKLTTCILKHNYYQRYALYIYLYLKFIHIHIFKPAVSSNREIRGIKNRGYMPL